MGDQQKEYSIAKLIDHPGLGWVMTEDGIDRRSLELILDRPSDGRRRTNSGWDKITDYGRMSNISGLVGHSRSGGKTYPLSPETVRAITSSWSWLLR